MKFVAENEEDLSEKVWNYLIKKFKPGLVIGLEGDLGVGKTTLVKDIVSRFGYNKSVSSPTFVIKKIYEIPNNKYGINSVSHIDLYRLGESVDTGRSEIEGLVDEKDHIYFIEWSDYIKNPSFFDIVIKINHIDSNKREVEIS